VLKLDGVASTGLVEEGLAGREGIFIELGATGATEVKGMKLIVFWGGRADRRGGETGGGGPEDTGRGEGIETLAIDPSEEV
jgi:hypothetical protein